MGNKHKLFLACTIFALTFVIVFSRSIFTNNLIFPLKPNPFFRIAHKLPTNLGVETYDPFYQFFPWLHFNKESLKHHELPLWNPYNGCGAPYIANMQSEFFYPLNIFVYLFDWKWGLLLLYFFKFFLVGLFAYLYLSEIGIDYRASIIASIATMYSGLMAMFQYPQSGIVFCFFFGLWSIELIIKHFDRFKGYGLLMLAFVIAVFAGHPEMLFFMVFVIGMYFLIRLFSEYGFTKKAYLIIGKTGLVISAGILISSIQLLPFIEYLHFSAILAFRNYIQSSLLHSLTISIAVLNKFFNGSIISNSDSELIIPIYIGIPLFIFGISGIMKSFDSKFVKAISVLSFITFIIPFNVPLVNNIVSAIPLLNVSEKQYLWVFSGYCLIIAGSLYLDEIFKQKIKSKTINTAIYITLILMFVLLIIHRKYYTLMNIKPMIIINVVILVILFFLIRIKNNNIKAILLGIFVFMTTGLTMTGFSGGTYKYFYPTNPIINRIKQEQGHFRSIAITKNRLEAWGADINTFYDIEDPRNYDTMGVKWYDKFALNFFSEPFIINFLNVKFIVTSPRPKVFYNSNQEYDIGGYDIGMGMSVGSFKPIMGYNGFTLYENPYVFNRAFMVYDYKIADTHDEAFELVRQYASQLSDTAVIFKEDAKYASFTPGNVAAAAPPDNNVSFDKYTPNYIKLHVDTASPGLLVISNTYFPGWHAYIDGRKSKVIRTDYAFQGVFVPKGIHEIKLDYMPLSFVIGLIFSIAGVAAIPLIYIFLFH